MLGELISAGANILGGILGSNAADKQAEANRQMQLDITQHGLNYKAADKIHLPEIAIHIAP